MAVKILKEEKERGLCLIKTKHESLIDCANSLAISERERIQELFNVSTHVFGHLQEKMALLQKRFTESNQVKTRRMTADGVLLVIL